MGIVENGCCFCDYAVVIGIDLYNGKEFTPLKGARGNAMTFKEWMLKNKK
jgi:hypothetical protein